MLKRGGQRNAISASEDWGLQKRRTRGLSSDGGCIKRYEGDTEKSRSLKNLETTRRGVHSMYQTEGRGNGQGEETARGRII